MTGFEDYQALSSARARSLRASERLEPSEWPAEWSQVSAKTYTRLPTIQLPHPPPIPTVSLHHVLTERRTKRSKTEDALSIELISGLLHHSFGLHPTSNRDDFGLQRAYPSAGARFPIEAYLVANGVVGLDQGVYHYSTLEHSLAALRSEPVRDELRTCFGYEWVHDARAILILTAVMSRTCMKYGERGYRFALFEAGHLMQNILLLATSYSIPAAPVGGFADSRLTRWLDLHWDVELVLYCAVLS